MPRTPPSSTLFPYTTLFRSISANLIGAVLLFRGGRLGIVRTARLLLGRGPGNGVFAHGGALLRLIDARLNLDRKSTRLNSSHQIISYAVFCLKKKMRPQRRS